MSQAATATASTPGRELLPDSTGAFTTASLVWIGLFALVVLFAIGWGMRLKRKRKAAEREVKDHNADLRAAAASPPAVEGEPAPERFIPPPAGRPPLAVPGVIPLESGTPATGGDPADGPVTQLKGLGPKVAERLAELGITTVGQVAALTDDRAAELEAELGPFRGRMARDRWLEQARFLAAGDRAGFESVFGRL